jgi:UDP-glucose:(heptosyl)LPS alpha-1,3-glucosyltransferase
MKLALIRLKYTGYGGAERYVNRLASALIEKGHEVHLLAREWDAPDNTGLIFHRIRSAGGPTLIRQPAFARAVAREVDKGGFDLVHSFDRTYSQDVYRAGDGCHKEFLLRRGRVQSPVHGFIDRINPRHRMFLDLERRLFSDPRLKKVLANSKQGKSEIVRHYGLPENMIEVVYNGLDKTRFHPGLAAAHRASLRNEIGLGPDEPVILFMGSGFLRKGLRETIRALASARGRLLVVGKDNAAPYQALAERMGVAGRVQFLGPRNDAERFHGAADIFVLPGWYEPFSNACLEAMAAGLPVVAAEETGAAEVIEAGLNGFTVPIPVQPDRLAEKINRAYALDRNALIEANQRLLAPFDWDINVEKTLKTYEEILNLRLTIDD